MKVFLTGAGGQLGQAVQDIFSSHTVVPFKHPDLDITDAAAVRSAMAREKPDMVINAAAYNNVDAAEANPGPAFAVNEKGPENLALAAAEINIPVVHVSTDYVFDGKKRHPYTEVDPVNPLSQYARSKWMGEEAVRKRNPKHYIVRTAWVFDARGDNFFKKMLHLSKMNKGPMRIVNDQFSSPTYAPHLAEAILKLIESEVYGTYHLVGRGVASRYEEFIYFRDKMGIKMKVWPILSQNFKQAAERPVYSPLTTVQVPRIILPPWEQGVDEFVKEFQRMRLPA